MEVRKKCSSKFAEMQKIWAGTTALTAKKPQCPVLMWSVAGSRHSNSGSTPVPGTPAGIWCISGACSGAHLNPGSQPLKLKAKSRERPLSAFLYNEDISLFLLHQLRNVSGITLIPEFPISFPFPVKKSLYSLVFNHHPDHKIFSLWVGFTTL